MALEPRLAQIANGASGVYQLTFDKSQTISQTQNTIRLIVGFSKKGPFNTPVLVPDSDFFRSVYGDIDRTLERKGSWFHRTCLTALEEGPILVLNLLNLNNDLTTADPDTVEHVSFSTSISDTNGPLRNDLLSLFYKRDKFWIEDPEEFIKTLGANAKLLNFVNLGQKPVSILTLKSNLSGFDITAKEWYGVGETPEFLDENDLLSDYFVDTYVFDGDWTDYQKLAIDPIFGKYFTNEGFQKEMLNDFLNQPEINTLGIYQGTLIPDFIDKNGINLNIETLINQDTSRTGVMCAIDKEKFDNEFLSGTTIDLIGHSIEKEGVTDAEFLSYKGSIVADFLYTEDTTLDENYYTPTVSEIEIEASPATDTGRKNVLHVTSSSSDFDTIKDSIKQGLSYIKGSITASGIANVSQFSGATLGDPYWLEIISITETASDIFIEVDDFGYDAGNTESNVEIDETGNGGTDVTIVFNPDRITTVSGANTSYIADRGSLLYEDWQSGKITDGDYVIDVPLSSTQKYLKFVSYTDAAGVDGVQIDAYTDETFSTQTDVPGFGDTETSDGASTAGTDINIISLTGALNRYIPATVGDTSNVVVIDNTSGDYTNKIVKGDYLVNNYGSPTEDSRLTRITEVLVQGTDIRVTALDPIAIVGGRVQLYKPVNEFFDTLNFVSLSGFNLLPRHMPNNTNARMNEILGVLTNTNLFSALAEREFRFRYIVDTFNHGIEAGSKSIYARLCQEKGNCIALLNGPSFKDFKESVDPSFKPIPTDADPDPSIDTSFIPTGGNLQLNPSNIYSLPSTSDGSRYVAFFGPNIRVRDRGKTILVPPAGYVSNLYVRKWTQDQPWSIVAWQRRGVISGANIQGLEVDLDKNDRDNLEPFGYNTIINKRGVGPMITSNATAQQTIKTALSQIHAVEVLIYVIDGIYDILNQYVWEFNNPQNRLEIKNLADQFLQTVLAAGGVYDFRNIMDTSNNTPEIIDENIGVIDTYIEIVRGFRQIVHRTTILRTGQISTGEFL